MPHPFAYVAARAYQFGRRSGCSSSPGRRGGGAFFCARSMALRCSSSATRPALQQTIRSSRTRSPRLPYCLSRSSSPICEHLRAHAILRMRSAARYITMTRTVDRENRMAGAAQSIAHCIFGYRSPQMPSTAASTMPRRLAMDTT